MGSFEEKELGKINMRSDVKDLVIIGAGGFGREVRWLIERINKENRRHGREESWHLAGFIDDDIEAGTMMDGIPVLGGISWPENFSQEISAVCAIGNSLTRKAVVERIVKNARVQFPNLIDPSVMMSDTVILGKGNILCAGNILTVDIQIGDFTILNLDCTVGHDVRIGSYVTMYPSVNVSGSVSIGNCSEVGTGCHIIQGITIASETISGAGSVIIRDLPGRCTAVGNPARVIKTWN